VVEGARASVARPVVAGTPTAEQRRVHQAVQQAYFAALHQVRPGVTGHLVDRAAREVLASAGYGRYFGHAVGRGLHAGPRLRPRSDAVLEEGMVVTIGPGVYIPGWGGLRIEDTVVVGRQGCDVLSTATTDLLQVPPPVVAQPDLGLLRLAP
jgi:Xaa-Pro aminopeptidase